MTNTHTGRLTSSSYAALQVVRATYSHLSGPAKFASAVVVAIFALIGAVSSVAGLGQIVAFDPLKWMIVHVCANESYSYQYSLWQSLLSVRDDVAIIDIFYDKAKRPCVNILNPGILPIQYQEPPPSPGVSGIITTTETAEEITFSLNNAHMQALNKALSPEPSPPGVRIFTSYTGFEIVAVRGPHNPYSRLTASDNQYSIRGPFHVVAETRNGIHTIVLTPAPWSDNLRQRLACWYKGWSGWKLTLLCPFL